MLTVRRNHAGWEWALVDEQGSADFMSRRFGALYGYMTAHDIDAVSVEVEPGEYLEMNLDMMEEMSEAGARNIIIA